MNIVKTILWVFLSIGLLFSCKESESDIFFAPNEKRINTITGYNNYNEATSKIEFNYVNNKVLGWLYFTKNDNKEWREIKKIDIEYHGIKATTFLQHKQDDSWITKQICTFLIINNQVHEKIISRMIFPECLKCWKYYYKYAGTQIIEWEKHIKTENNSWVVCEKMEYIFTEHKLISRNCYVNFNNTGLTLDYVRNYFYNNNQVGGWLSGIYIEDKEWMPTEKVELSYDQGKVVAHDFSVWNANEKTWQHYGSVSYTHNNQGYLVEENNSEGNKTVYEYEPGTGNASVLFYAPDCFFEPQPMLKSTFITFQ